MPCDEFLSRHLAKSCQGLFKQPMLSRCIKPCFVENYLHLQSQGMHRASQQAAPLSKQSNRPAKYHWESQQTTQNQKTKVNMKYHSPPPKKKLNHSTPPPKKKTCWINQNRFNSATGSRRPRTWSATRISNWPLRPWKRRASPWTSASAGCFRWLEMFKKTEEEQKKGKT